MGRCKNSACIHNIHIYNISDTYLNIYVILCILLIYSVYICTYMYYVYTAIDTVYIYIYINIEFYQ